jgi:hypothetical protein
VDQHVAGEVRMPVHRKCHEGHVSGVHGLSVRADNTDRQALGVTGRCRHGRITMFTTMGIAKLLSVNFIKSTAVLLDEARRGSVLGFLLGSRCPGLVSLWLCCGLPDCVAAVGI